MIGDANTYIGDRKGRYFNELHWTPITQEQGAMRRKKCMCKVENQGTSVN